MSDFYLKDKVNEKLIESALSVANIKKIAKTDVVMYFGGNIYKIDAETANRYLKDKTLMTKELLEQYEVKE